MSNRKIIILNGAGSKQGNSPRLLPFFSELHDNIKAPSCQLPTFPL